jgi:dienelactone hydrolase
LAACEDIFSKSKSLTLRTYPDAHHAFDVPAFDPPREYRFGTLGYNKQAAEAAWVELIGFLKR